MAIEATEVFTRHTATLYENHPAQAATLTLALALPLTQVFTRHGASNLRCRFTPVLPPAPPPNANHTAPLAAAAAAAAALPFFEVDGVKNWDHVQCLLPPTDVPRTVLVQLSTSAGTEYTPLNASHAVTQYDASRPPAPRAALPRVSGFPGGALVTIEGENFAPVGRGGAPLTCHFGTVAVLATFVSVMQARSLVNTPMLPSNHPMCSPASSASRSCSCYLVITPPQARCFAPAATQQAEAHVVQLSLFNRPATLCDPACNPM